jgi:ubiquinone/menaquinone biosynthesis C-methylase UbiE
MLRRTVLLWSFDRLYHEFAWGYDIVAAVVSGGYWRRWIVACIPYLNAEQVLEIGCGTGYLQLELARRGIAHTGLDASPQMLRGARRRIGTGQQLICARAPWLPVPSAHFSDVVATFPAPYVLEAPTLKEIIRVLRPDGRLVIVDGGAWNTRDASVDATNGPYNDEHYRRPLEARGFSVTTNRVALGPTTVAVIVAERMRANS